MNQIIQVRHGVMLPSDDAWNRFIKLRPKGRSQVIQDNVVAPIVDAAADVFRVSVADLASDCRVRSIAWPRHAVMWVARRRCDLSYKRIGRALKRDHSTVISGVANIDNQFHWRHPICERVEELARRVEFKRWEGQVWMA